MYKTLELPEGFALLTPLPGLCPGPTGGLKRPLFPSPNNFAPPISNSWLRPCHGRTKDIIHSRISMKEHRDIIQAPNTEILDFMVYGKTKVMSSLNYIPHIRKATTPEGGG